MKRAVLILSALLIISSAGAQNRYDALRYSQVFYEGSARSLSMGNAFTSVGGDLGVLSMNPASAAIYRYSEFMFTPSLTKSKSSVDYLGKNIKDDISKFGVSSLGYVNSLRNLRNTGRVKAINISVAINKINNFNSRMSATGTEAVSSWLGAVAASASGYPSSELDIQSADDTYPFFESGATWRSVLAWNSNLLDLLPDSDQDYIAATENLSGTSILTGGPLNQDYVRETTGGITEFIVNLSGNIDDKLYLGGSIGVQSIQYSDYQRYSETAVDISDFNSGFKSFSHTFRQNTTGAAINAKLGIIFLPTEGLRLGASIATPTFSTLTEEWDESIRAQFSDGYSQSILSPVGEYRYIVTAPARINLGASYVFGKYGVISADYEFADYSTIRMKESESYDNGIFTGENNSIRNEFQYAGNLRVGLEFRPSQTFALRAGYSLYQSPEKEFDNNLSFVSAGLGFRGQKGFFLDLGIEGRLGSEENFSLYEDYSGISSPVGKLTYTGLKMLATIGFRF